MAEKRNEPCIVSVGSRGAMQLGHYGNTPRAGILVYGDAATLFRNRRQARRAIRRTQDYAEQQGLKWEILQEPWTVDILLVVPPEAVGPPP